MALSLIIPLTDEQLDLLRPLIETAEEGGAVFAQLYMDGMRVNVFNAATAKAVADAIGTADGSIASSAQEAQANQRLRRLQ